MLRDHYIFSNGRLKRKDNTIYFLDENETKRSLPVHQVDNLYVFGEVDLNSSLLNLLSQHSVHLHIFNYYGFYAGTFCPRSKKVSGFTVVQQSAHYLDAAKRLYLAKMFLQSAVHHMLRNIRRHKEKTEEYVRQIELEAEKMETAMTIQELMGIEGRIRQHYYQSFNEILKQDFIFEKRTKQPPQDPLNALISFGNTLCYTTVLSEIYKTPLDPTISFLHEPSTKRFSLSLDLAEIFKPLIVDAVIIACINNRIITKKHFESLDGMVFLNEEGKKKFIREWENKLATSVQHRQLKRKVSYRYFMRLECYKLIKHFIGDERYKPLKAWW
ncbi:type I-B CRISPR-associated endonuclease Cas1 [Geobacillus sp. NFOSA3]|uniref:CRISPR-associated endonuclease Cas1 n=1 Tax=Parageobacillus galactosidasius TaxID=883812 RepID=A0A226QHL6_9BACL|nr:type I-B CRISPR-associated endonuclease Cas1b [Parageobacillus galactosidasius]NNU92986.1 type I-B CRISPR-associated endonuclease Cas1 [Geobacillus sp. NFOSA3]OXB92096.1 subtype I-B CRISPR-associated endonuclease Cas1 [Parageobacillus galactosidasius]